MAHSNSEDTDGLGILSAIRKHAYPMSRGDIDKELDEQEKGGDDNVKVNGFTRGGDSSKDKVSADGNGSVATGERSERWFSRIEGKVQENTVATNENRARLVRIDERTALTVKLLVGMVLATVAAIAGGMVLHYML